MKLFLIRFLTGILLVCLCISIGGCADNIQDENKQLIANKAVKEMPFKSCMNIGNALDAPKDIKWDVEMQYEYFDKIKDAGFDAVRLPVRFSDYAKDTKNYKLDEGFMNKVDSYIDYALSNDLYVILDFHHFVEIMEEPKKYKECYLKIWQQLSERYKNYSDKLIFELLNEPKDNLEGDLWNNFLKEGVSTIRKKNKKRKIIVGPDHYCSVYSLNHLVIPDDDNIIVSFHYYEPNEVAFQGSLNHAGFEEMSNIDWNGSKEEREYLESRFKIAREYSEKYNVPIFLGEFGVNKKAPEEARIKWTEAVTVQAMKNKFAYGYWELCSEFGIYDEENDKWQENILSILTNR